MKMDNHLDTYLNSPDFEKDCEYWKQIQTNVRDYIKFYNLESNNYKNIKIPFNPESSQGFLSEYGLSKFDFISAILSLYLSRVDGTKGCLLKTFIPGSTVEFDKNALLAIGYDGENSFIDHVNDMIKENKISLEHTKVDIGYYLKEDLTFYSINDLTKGENISIMNGEGNALTLNVYENSLDLIYNENLFLDVYMEHMAKNISALISDALNNPNKPCKDMNILSDKEKELISDFSKGKHEDMDLDKSLAIAFRENALIYPDTIAIDDGFNQITYSEMESSSNSIAYDLSNNHNIGLGNHVGLMLPRNYHFPELVLALNKIGAAFIPIDADYPLKRIEHMLDIGESKHIITTRELAKLHSFNANIICIEDLKYDSDVEVEINGKGDDLFAIMFTSGTTGLPKGVKVANRQICGIATAYKNIFDISEGEIIGCYASFSFVASYRIYSALYLGACARIFNDDERKDNLLLIRALKEKPIAQVALPPSVGVPIFENEDLDIDYLVLTGAKINEFKSNNSHTKLVNNYGLTESPTVIAKIFDSEDNDEISLGKPVCNTWIYILDKNNKQVPIGVPGEICISSNYLSPGYVGDDDLTNIKFIDNPFSDCDDNKRMYKTGDIGYYNFNGEIEFIGREDNQLSVRGFRIESEEVIKIMKSFPNIKEIVLDVDYDNLIAYYTADGELDIGLIRDGLNDELPYYMIPSLFIELDEIPLNLNGKIDKSALKNSFNESVDIDIEDRTLSIVVDSFREVLHRNSILIDDDFVALGGNSLSAMNLQMLLKERLDVNLYANEIMELSSPVNISNKIKFDSDIYSDFTVNYDFDSLCPLSESQLNVYLDENVKDVGTGYNNAFKIQFNENYSADDIEKAINKLTQIHPILNARVINNEEGLYFIFDSHPEIRQGTPKDIDSFVRPFELERYLSRFLIIESESVLCFDCHHLIFDGTSIDVLLNCLESILKNDSPDSVDDGVLRQISFEENISREYFSNAKDFFDDMLVDNDEVCELLSSVNPDDEMEYINTFDVDEDFNSFLQSHSITPNQFFSSVFGYTLSRFTGCSKVLFSLIENGRGYMDLSNSIGMFVKTLPVLMDCSNQDVDSFLNYSSNLINSVMKFDLYPFRILANDYDLNSSITFQYAHDIFSEFNKDFLSVQSLREDSPGDLNFFIYNRGNHSFEVRVLYSNMFSRDFIKRFVESFKLVLDGMTDAEKLSEINYTTISDLHIMDSYNETEKELRYDDVLDAFNDNLAQHPENMLVSMNNRSYNYAEGAHIADKIAKQLIELGVESQDCIPFLVERSELYMFCSLGIMSIGAVNVPLDDNLPDERIKFILEDCNCKIVIVSDATYDRAKELANDEMHLLNISGLVNGDMGVVSSLPVTYSNLACILYTSGTTGIPKGVKITRKAILNLCAFYADTYGLSNEDVYGLFSSIGFDAGPQAIFQVVYAGACLSVIPEDIKLNIPKLNQYFADHNVSHAFISTLVGKLFLETVDSTSLKSLSVGGEKLGDINSPEDYVIVDEFGPTEAFAFILSINDSDKIDSSSVGFLNYNSKAYILDLEGRRVPIGAVGELYLAGYQVTPGYLNREEETEKALMSNPFDDEEDYSRLYRSGDMVRSLPDGSMAIIGRRDSQVKIRGNRVELTEIEDKIREIDYIDDVTIQTIKNGTNNELVAYVVVSGDMDDDELRDNVQSFVGEYKPDYMIPSFVISLDSIPLNVNGKVDKKALPEVDLDDLRVEYVAPTNEIEKSIVEAFEKAFNQENISLFDDFVRIGGDSITAIRVISLLERNGISCSARDILNFKTPYLIAENVEKVNKVSYEATVGEVDLLPIQSYFFDQIELNDFSQDLLLKSKTDLDLNLLQEAFDELCNVHDMLRASYRHEDNDVMQEILPLNTRICEIEEYEISDLESIDEIIGEFHNSLNINGDLIKIALIHCDDECYLVFVVHHLIIDGVSWSILIDDLTYLLNQKNNEGEANLLRPYPYKSWVNDVKSLAENISEDEKQHWIEISNLLDDESIKGRSKGFTFNVEAEFDADNLLMLSEEEYWALCIARAYKKTYNKDIIFNRESYGRDESLADVSRTVGWFTSQFPVHVAVDNEYDEISLIRDVYSLKESLKDINHLGLNYGSMIYILDELDYIHCPVTFNFLSSEFTFENEMFQSYKNKLYSDSEEITLFDLDSTSFGVTLNIYRIDDSYLVRGDYASDTFIGDKFKEFIDNIKFELDFIGNNNPNYDNIICCLSEPQLGIYLDEIVHDKGTAYSGQGIFECNGHSIDEIENIIHALIRKHPILKGRIDDRGNIPLLICDSYPSIKIIEDADYSNLIVPFDFSDSLTRFFIIDDDDEGKFLLYDIHHIIGDATTFTIIDKELSDAFNGKLNEDIDLGFVYASNDSFNSKFDNSYDEAHEFFKNILSKKEEAGSLLKDGGSADNSIKLPIPEVRSRVEAFCREYGITTGNFLNAVFAYTLSRFSGSSDVYYTFNENGRHETYSQDACGMFVRTIPIIVNCENMSVEKYLLDVSNLILDSMRCSMYPFRLLANEFYLINDISFEYNHDLNDVSNVKDELIIEDMNKDLVSDILCVVNDLDDGYLINIQSSSDYSNDLIIRFLNAFRDILIGMLDSVDLSDINYTSSSDLNILDSYNETAHELVYNDILDGFSDSLSKFPDNELVLSDEESYTYSEAAYLINEIQRLLKDNDIGVNDKVCVYVDRNHWVLLANMGVLSLGASYVPIDENLPDSRIEYMIEKSESKAIVVTDTFQKRAKEIAGKLNRNVSVINVSSLNREVEQLNKLDYVDPSLNGVACILFTSGTTGNPKAVQVGRYSITNMVSFYADNSNFRSGDVYGVFASVGFDVSLQHYAALFCGGAVTWVPNDIRLNISELNRYFIKHGVTHTIITTQVSKLFVDTVKETSIKYLCGVGEKMGAVTAPEDYSFVDVYGPTEATSSMTSINVKDKIDVSSVGGPDWNTKIYVLDAEKRRVPFGATGELYISGYQVSRGYLNDPEKTNDAFFDNPFDGETDGYHKMYKTGDVVRLLRDGTIGFIGRNDSQVKIRGNRVELSEIESTIREMDYIENLTVQTVKNGTNNELVAYVVLKEDMADIDIKNHVCDYVAKHKPEYMIPSFVIKLDSIPLNVNGKVDKKALPAVDLDNLHAEYIPPTTDAEKDIVEAFKEVLNQTKIGVYDDFIRLGGDSLSAIRLLTHLEDYNITVAEILSLRTPYAIAKNIKNTTMNLDVYSLDTGCPLNEPQLNVYLDILANDKFDSYMIPSYMKLTGDYEIQDIIDALEEMFKTHPILNTCISEDFEVPYLVKGLAPSIFVETDSDTNIIDDFINRKFDLYDSLCRFLILESHDSYKLFAVFHHIIFDAMSERVFKQDLKTILDGGSVDFDDSFLKVSAFSKQITQSDEYLEAKNFYENLLADADEAGILLDSVDSEGAGFAQYDLDVDGDSVKLFIDKYGITDNVLFTSAFAYTLSRFVGADDVLFNIVENGRDRFKNFKSIGMYVNTLPIQVNCKNQNISSFMEYMSTLIYDAMKYNYYPFRILTNEYHIDSSILFQYIPNWIGDDEEDASDEFQHTPYLINDDVEDAPKEEYLTYDINNSISDFIVEVFQKKDNRYALRIIHSPKYSNDFVNHFALSYNLILQEIIKADKLQDVNYIGHEDIEILDRLNLTQHDLRYDDILDAFNNNLAKFPNNNLVSMNDNTYTYSQGAFIADKIAKHLIEEGAKSQDCIAFLVERNELYMFSVLAILSIGGIYVPLDDTHPDERIQFILEDADAKFVIVSDETIDRAQDLAKDSILLNISDILREDVESAYSLPASYGDLSCILYTSGTTGIPKGVKVTRKSSLNVSSYYADTYNLTNEDIYGLYSSIGFDAASLAILSTIYAGACLSIIPDEIRLDMNRLNDYFIENGITQTFITTQVGKLFVQTIDKTSLKVLVVGGEKLGDFESPEDYDFVDIYGPTEAFVFIASSNNSLKSDSSSVGNLIYNTKAYILDGEKRKVPVGAVGELYLAGYQIAEGYLNRPDEKAFMNNPFEDDEDYTRLYRTGDMVRLLPDGTLAVVGRHDNQVKIRGNRVELSEVEATIREIDYVNDVTVKTIKNGDNNELIAYVVISNDLDEDDLRDAIENYVGDSKPSYMVPSHIVRLDEIPLNVNGKVDKRKLPKITIETKDYEAPRNYLEIVIANVFSEVLNIDQPISRNDEFSALGGDSIGVISLISKLREMNVRITVKDVIDNQSVKRIAKKAEYKISSENISQESFEGFVDSTPTIDYFWNLNLNNPSYFHVPCWLETSRRIDEDILAKSMMDIVNYHDMLRAKVKDRNLFIRPQDDEEIFTIEHCDISDVTRETERINQEIDIFNGPLIKLAIFEDEECDYLYICFHHLLVDSNSLRIIINDLNLAYAQRSNGFDTELYGKSSSYQDYALAIDNHRNDKIIMDQKDYWENTLNFLKRLKHTKICSDVVEEDSSQLSNSDMPKRDSFLLRLPYQISSILFTNAPKYYDCSINGLFLSMIVKSWKDIMDEDEVSVRLSQDGRKNFDRNLLLERTVGWLSSYYPVIIRCEGEDNKQIIGNVERILDEVPYEGFAYPILMGIETDEIPLISFSYTNEFNVVGGGKMFDSKHRSDLANFTASDNTFLCDIAIYGYTINNETFFKFDYNSERFSKEIMEKLGNSILENINSIIYFTREDYSEDAYIFSNHPDKKKLFFVHSANFGSEYFYYMAQKLKNEYSFIVIEPYNRIHKENQLSSIEEYAKKYIEIMKSIQPEGPYYIGGYCFGGIIAHEMAVQLKKQNEKVDKLILFETYYINDDKLMELALEEQILYARDFLKDGILNPKHENIEDMISYALSSVDIMYDYKPSYYDGDAIYFKATLRNEGPQSEVSRRLDEFYYSKEAGGYEDYYNREKFKIKEVPVGHDHLLNVDALKIIIPELLKFLEEDE